MLRKLLFVWSFLGLLVPAQAADFKIDPDHSQVMFKIRHMLSHVTGRFDKFAGYFDYDQSNFKSFKSSGSIEAASINTNVTKRDNHLRSADFFDVEKYPTLSFVSTGLSGIKGSKAKLSGDLTIHGVTKPVVFDLEILGEVKDPWGNQRASLTATTKINRSDYGVKWNKILDSGGVLVGEEVEIILEIEGVKS